MDSSSSSRYISTQLALQPEHAIRRRSDCHLEQHMVEQVQTVALFAQLQHLKRSSTGVKGCASVTAEAMLKVEQIGTENKQAEYVTILPSQYVKDKLAQLVGNLAAASSHMEALYTPSTRWVKQSHAIHLYWRIWSCGL